MYLIWNIRYIWTVNYLYIDLYAVSHRHSNCFGSMWRSTTTPTKYPPTPPHHKRKTLRRSIQAQGSPRWGTLELWGLQVRKVRSGGTAKNRWSFAEESVSTRPRTSGPVSWGLFVPRSGPPHQRDNVSIYNTRETM